MAVLPASDWLTDSSSARFWEPLRIQRPGVGSASMMPCRYDRRSGTRCTSSRTAPRGNCARNPLGSSRAKARSSGDSRER